VLFLHKKQALLSINIGSGRTTTSNVFSLFMIPIIEPILKPSCYYRSTLIFVVI